jgi:uncharacterized protein YjiS (DUF1127 family)
MAEKTLRGTGLGGASYESDRGVHLVPRHAVRYLCPNEHRIEVPFADGVHTPLVWECPRCGSEAVAEGATAPTKAPTKPARTHWDMLLERRSIHELQLLLDEQITDLHGGRRTA